jgi:hypothetical protein
MDKYFKKYIFKTWTNALKLKNHVKTVYVAIKKAVLIAFVTPAFLVRITRRVTT